ncbi:MAG: ferrous iron transport protein A [Bdellovibrionales bacterium]
MNLSECPLRQLAEVTEVSGDAHLRHRLMDLGIYAGVLVEVVGAMPFSGPLIIRAQGATLALRRGEAACIQVQARKTLS